MPGHDQCCGCECLGSTQQLLFLSEFSGSVAGIASIMANHFRGLQNQLAHRIANISTAILAILRIFVGRLKMSAS